MAEPNTSLFRKYLQPQTIARLARMDLRARLVVEGFIAGLHKSPYKGFSVEFAEHRAYQPGDELRHIDWRVFGRRDKFYVKEFEEETNLSCHILLDCSASMGAPGEEPDKLAYGSYLAASLAYLLIRQQDSVGLVTFDTRIRQRIPPRGQPQHLHQILACLDAVRPGGRTDLADIFHDLAATMKRRSLIVVISDLWDEPGRVWPGLHHFRHKKHEVILFHLMSRREAEFPFRGPTLFVDQETGERVRLDPASFRQAYLDGLGRFQEDYRRNCRESLIDYVPLRTDTPFDQALTAYLAKRGRLG